MTKNSSGRTIKYSCRSIRGNNEDRLKGREKDLFFVKLEESIWAREKEGSGETTSWWYESRNEQRSKKPSARMAKGKIKAGDIMNRFFTKREERKC